ncbi:MAG: RHS repeat protein, partial [Planctomycetes bacterium]|nr:RHS repeat protein [Planctomycetota bacterium]
MITDTVSTPLGPNWTHNFNISVKRQGTNNYQLVYIGPDGKRIFYNDTNNDGVYVPLPRYGSYSVVTYTGSSYILSQKDRTELTFNASGQLTQIKDVNDNFISLTYTGITLTLITLPNSAAITLTYNTDNLIDTVTDPAGNLTTIGYTNGLLDSISKTGTPLWQYQFYYKTGTNLVETVSNPLNDDIIYGYDAMTPPRLTAITRTVNSILKTRSISYNDITKTTIISDFDGITSTIKYNYPLAVLNNTIDPSGNTITNTFDSGRNLLSRTNSRGYTTFYSYDIGGNATAITDAIGCTTNYYYQDATNPDLPTLIIDPRNVAISLTYDTKGNLLTRIDAYGITTAEQRTNYEYYTNGKLWKEARDSLGLNIVTEYVYSNGYLWKKIIDPAGIGLTYEYEYDVLGQLKKAYNSYDAAHPKNSTLYTEYDYDNRGNRTQVTAPYDTTLVRSVVTKFDYTLLDKTDTRTDDFGYRNVVTKYNYNNLGLLTSTVVDQGELNITASTEYYDNSRVKKTTDPESATTEYFYYSNKWFWYTKKQITDTGYAFTYYSYDANGNKTSEID